MTKPIDDVLVTEDPVFHTGGDRSPAEEDGDMPVVYLHFLAMAGYVLLWAFVCEILVRHRQ